MTTLECPAFCGLVTPSLSWKVMSNGRVHLGARCPNCQYWIKWVPQIPEWLALAPERVA